MDGKVITLQDFLSKVDENESRKVKITHIDIENFGLVEFVRPREGVLLDYLDETIKAVDIQKEKIYGDSEGDENTVVGERENSKADMRKLVEASNKFVYKCCPMLQSKEVRDKFKGITPDEIPAQIFGNKKVMDLANELSNIFDGATVQKEVEEEVKN
ncbi:MAG: hypothetical protein ACRDAS_11730 [Cetobacterium sp.]